MTKRINPAAYEAWYHTHRGAWIGQTEFALLLRTLRPAPGATLLDLGCGTGYFSRCFSKAGLRVTGVDPDSDMLAYSAHRDDGVAYAQATALRLPFRDQSFDYVSAVTSLCFIEPPSQAIKEMRRVARRAVILGLLSRRSLLHFAKRGRGGYEGARWDSREDVLQWLASLPTSVPPDIRSAIFLPGGGAFARVVELCLPNGLPFGGFLAVNITL